MPELRNLIRNDEPLFPEYTGRKPEGLKADCIITNDLEWESQNIRILPGLKWVKCNCGPVKPVVMWAASRDSEAIYIWVSYQQEINRDNLLIPITGVQVKIEPQRLSPCRKFTFDTENSNSKGNPIRIIKNQINKGFVCRIEIKDIGLRITIFIL